ncbi:MAG: GNAT family N-acetyltransferase [Salaquimonas sp.]|jgi:ribosomal protein S18 acetylase RimI-like enzyme|nr:GNAT family N-acetyltransferase [Salaquimonas sp.]
MTTIRHMVAEDAEAVSALLRESWRQTYGPLMGEEKALATSAAWHDAARLAAEAGNDQIISFVAEEDDGSIAGHAMASMDADGQAWFRRLYIVADRFGSGLADDLLRAILAAHSGLSSIALEVAEGNDRAVAFYSKHGFIVAERKTVGSDVEDVPTLVMKKLLPRA